MSDIDLWNTDLLDTLLDLIRYRYHQYTCLPPRRLEDVLKTCLQDVITTSSRRLEDQQMFAGLLEISDRFSSKLNVFNYMIFQCCVYILESFITVFYDPWKHSGNIAWKVINYTTKVYFFDKGDGWNLFKWKKNIKKKILIWHMVVETVKK